MGPRRNGRRGLVAFGVVVVSALLITESPSGAQPSRFLRRVQVGASGPGTSTDDNEKFLSAGAFIDGGPPNWCVAGGDLEVVAEPVLLPEQFDTRVKVEVDPETGGEREVEVVEGTRVSRSITLRCGGVERTIISCVSGSGTLVCPPRRPQVDSRGLARRMTEKLWWPKVRPSFSPNATGSGRYDFALTQAPLFFSVPQGDWKILAVQAMACNDDGDCAFARVRATPKTLVFVWSKGDELEAACDDRFATSPVESPIDYQVREKMQDSCRFTFKHSSTTQPRGVFGSEIGITYQIERLSWKLVDGSLIDFVTEIEDEYEYFNSVDVNVRVGEVEAVNGTSR
jgi:hypothetical protein